MKKHGWDTYELGGSDGDSPSSATNIFKVEDSYRVIKECIHGIKIGEKCAKCIIQIKRERK